MDQNRLEELKRLLQKRHQEPKRGLEQNSNGENFKVPNSETLNFEASNFEVSNSEFPNSEISNYETQNSKAPNSDPDALNLEIGAAQNSTCKNSAEPQNFISDDNGPLRQNSKARDYDKDPLVIKDHTYYDYMKYSIVPTMVGLLIALAFATIVNPICLEYIRLKS